MSITPPPPSTPRVEDTPPPARRGWPLLAWLIILAIVGYYYWEHATGTPAHEADEVVQVEVQSRFLVALHSWNDEVQPEEQIELLNRGPYGPRLRCAILLGELQGPSAALQQLDQLDDLTRQGHLEPSAHQQLQAGLLRRLYQAREHKEALPLSAAEQQTLRDELGWFGRLALTSADHPEDPERQAVLQQARRTLLALVGQMSLMGLGGLLGLLLLGIGLGLGLAGYLRGGMTAAQGHGGIYAETFACYMALYLGLGWLARYLPADVPRLPLSGLAMLLSLAALALPVLRGLSWQQVRQDVGLTLSRSGPPQPFWRAMPWALTENPDWPPRGRPLREVVLGPCCYFCGLPGMLGGAILAVLLMRLRQRLGLGPDEYSSSGMPTHPIEHVLAQGSVWAWVQVFILAAVCAPLVEEVMFRGVLYRHLRDVLVSAQASRLRQLAGIFLAMLAVSFLFAAIHPQGLLGIPALMSLALIFNLFREWRGTLIPSMIAHGINNAVVTVLVIVMAH